MFYFITILNKLKLVDSLWTLLFCWIVLSLLYFLQLLRRTLASRRILFCWMLGRKCICTLWEEVGVGDQWNSCWQGHASNSWKRSLDSLWCRKIKQQHKWWWRNDEQSTSFPMPLHQKHKSSKYSVPVQRVLKIKHNFYLEKKIFQNKHNT